ncbi:MAG: N-acetylmuramic acid 6-phosphate etherase [Clostridia bacterium]|nr:N-acetylmuramic acid 6-phosphate etherase [Clostridia bacterium]
MPNLSHLQTEQRNPASMHIDRMETLDMLRVINQEDHHVAEAVEKELPNIAKAVELIYAQLKNGGRLIYCGAGTSGRLGVLDASECPPTYGVDPGMVIGLIAGGEKAVTSAAEGAEDRADWGADDLKHIGFCAKDILVGIAASGRTPYAIGAMDHARSLGAPVIAVVCCQNSEMSRHADVTIAPVTGPEVVTGSSRMKAGTAQKMVLNMLSTATMIKLGKVYGNLMVDLKPTNEKLVQRAIRIVSSATGVDEQQARSALEAGGMHCKTAIVMLLMNLTADEARKALDAADDRIAGVTKED